MSVCFGCTPKHTADPLREPSRPVAGTPKHTAGTPKTRCRYPQITLRVPQKTSQNSFGNQSVGEKLQKCLRISKKLTIVDSTSRGLRSPPHPLRVPPDREGIRRGRLMLGRELPLSPRILRSERVPQWLWRVPAGTSGWGRKLLIFFSLECIFEVFLPYYGYKNGFWNIF